MLIHSIHETIIQKLRIWSHLPKKSLMKNFIFCAVTVKKIKNIQSKYHILNHF